MQNVKLKILVTGAKGQLGMDILNSELNNTRHCGLDSQSPELSGLQGGLRVKPSVTRIIKGVDLDDFDITDRDAVMAFIREYNPDCVIHCAAYTAVDKAEDEAELCMCINRDGTENIALACKEFDAEMIYISTDYVFDGAGDVPFEIDAPKAPLGVYGQSKLAGEEAVLKHLEKYYIVRISWVYGKHGHNFVKTMLRLAEDRDEINVVSDQVGSPSYTPDVAVLLRDMALSGKYGIYHATNEGFCSWAEFAEEIMTVSGSSCKVNPILTEQYPTKATRPKNSRMSKASLDNAVFARLPDWKDALRRYFVS